MDEQRPGPELGTPEAAVQSAVNLLAKATGINESRLAYYLDMYYQLRNTYEAAKARERLETQLLEENLLSICAASPLDPEQLRPMSKTEAEDTSSGPSGHLPLEGKAKAPDRKGEKNPNAMAAAEKRRIRERFIEARQKGGAPTAELLKACPTLTEGDVWKIVNGHQVGIDIYRALESALDQIEDSISETED